MSPMRILSSKTCGVVITFALLGSFVIYLAFQAQHMVMAALQRFPAVAH